MPKMLLSSVIFPLGIYLPLIILLAVRGGKIYTSPLPGKFVTVPGTF